MTEEQMHAAFQQALGVPKYYRNKRGYACYQKQWEGFKAAMTSLPRISEEEISRILAPSMRNGMVLSSTELATQAARNLISKLPHIVKEK